MSACISRHGEFSSHDLDDEHTCRLCGVLDEDALRAELRKLRAALPTPIRDHVEVAQAAEAAVLRADDTLIVRVESIRTREDFEAYADHLKALLPDVKLVVIAADQLLVYRSGGSDD